MSEMPHLQQNSKKICCYSYKMKSIVKHSTDSVSRTLASINHISSWASVSSLLLFLFSFPPPPPPPGCRFCVGCLKVDFQCLLAYLPSLSLHFHVFTTTTTTTTTVFFLPKVFFISFHFISLHIFYEDCRKVTYILVKAALLRGYLYQVSGKEDKGDGGNK